MAEAGYSIVVVGHSLGAGAAAMLAIWLKQSGVEDVTCFAFATPNCVSLDLATGCQDYVTSVVFRDDIIARFSPAALAKLHKELQDLNVERAIKQVPHESLNNTYLDDIKTIPLKHSKSELTGTSRLS